MHFTIIGQTIDTIVLLDDIELTVRKQKFLVGSKIEAMDSIKLNTVSGGSLTDMINRYLPIYIKQDAGGLSTIRFRGTSPDHTAIMFDGININSLTLGHSNMSNIPMFLFDEVKVQFGSSSSLYGTDAIGGSIQLNNKLELNKGFSTELQQDFGSFGSYFTGLKLGYSNNKIQYSIKAFYQQKENEFSFLNIAAKDFEKDEFIDDKQKNTAIKNYGILQIFNFKITDKLFFYTKQWYQNNWHEVQPNMSENYYGADYKEIENNNLRITTGLNYNSGKHKFTTGFGYVYDYQLYDNNYDETISTQTITGDFNYYNSNFLSGNFNVGMNYSHLTSDVYAYKEDIKEDRFDFYTSYKLKIIQSLTMAVNLRETVVIDYANQFAPSIGFDYRIIETNEKKINASVSVSKSFKIPSFNDRFWYPNGNPDILPENGMNYEIGSKYSIKGNKNTLNFGFTAFVLNIDNWIQWIPVTNSLPPPNDGTMWRPQNITEAQSIGVELDFDNTFKIRNVNLSWGIRYSLTNVSSVDDFWNFNFSEREQLFYTPKHIANLYTTVGYDSWYFNLSGSYTGERFTESREILEGYFLANASIIKNFNLKKNIFSINLNINNLFNKAYQNQAYYAMPGTNFNLSLKYLYK